MSERPGPDWAERDFIAPGHNNEPEDTIIIEGEYTDLVPFETIEEETGSVSIMLGLYNGKGGPKISIHRNEGGEGFIVIGPSIGRPQELPVGTSIIGRGGDIKVIDPSNISSREHLQVVNTGNTYSIKSLGANRSFEATGPE